MMQNKKESYYHKQCVPEEREIRNTLSKICTLVPGFVLPVDLQEDIFGPLGKTDFYTRRQALLLWDIYCIILEKITSCALIVNAKYLEEQNEEAVMDYWASAMDRILTNLYMVFTQSSIESFLEHFREKQRRSCDELF